MTTPRRYSGRWWISDRAGNIALVYPPNPALAVWLVAVVVGWTSLLSSERATRLTWLGKGALVVWALDEVVRGSSPVRRVLGAVVLAVQMWHLFW